MVLQTVTMVLVRFQSNASESMLSRISRPWTRESNRINNSNVLPVFQRTIHSERASNVTRVQVVFVNFTGLCIRVLWSRSRGQAFISSRRDFAHHRSQ